MSTEPMTPMAVRASRWCDELKRTGGAYLTVEWVKSKTWGRCARIMDHRNEKMAYAGECGYDKESAVLTELLCWLDDRISGCSGAGFRSVQGKCAEAGWDLAQLVSGNVFDIYLIKRKGSTQL